MRTSTIPGLVAAVIVMAAVMGCQTTKPATAAESAAQSKSDVAVAESSGPVPGGAGDRPRAGGARAEARRGVHRRPGRGILPEWRPGRRYDDTGAGIRTAGFGQGVEGDDHRFRRTGPEDLGRRRSSLPDRLAWDGKTDSGSAAEEGEYSAHLAVDYSGSFDTGTAASSPFVLDVTPPTGSLSLSAALFSPIESTDTITLKLSAASRMAKIDSWTMDIYDPGGNVFKSFSGKWPASTAVWNGKGAGGELVQSAEDYPVVAKVRDQFGNTGTVKTTVPVDILVEKTKTGYRYPPPASSSRPSLQTTPTSLRSSPSRTGPGSTSWRPS